MKHFFALLIVVALVAAFGTASRRPGSAAQASSNELHAVPRRGPLFGPSPAGPALTCSAGLSQVGTFSSHSSGE
jgi:hypothetical protein